MFKRKSLLVVGILAVAMLVGAVGCTPAELQALQGTLQNVDSVSGNLTVKLKDGTTQTFNFTDVKVDTIRQALGSASLEIGDQITIRAAKNGDVEEVETRYAEVDGVIKSLGPNSVVITTDDNKEITVNVTADTTIRIEDKSNATFADLKAGQKIEARYDVTNKNAKRISIEDEDEDEAGEIAGTIKSIDTTAKTVTITSRRKGDITINITATTIIRIEDHRTAAITDLKAGQQVEARYDVISKNAIKLKVETDGPDSDDNENND